MKECILAFDAGGTFLKAALYTLDAKLVENTNFAQAIDSSGRIEDIKASYTALLNSAKTLADQNGFSIIGVAVDTPGPFDYKNGKSLMKHKYASLYGVELRPWFYEVLGEIKVTFTHDSTAFILGAVSENETYCAGIMLGTGLGFSTMQAGSVLLAENGGPKYSLYNLPLFDGIVEDYISASGIIKLYNALGSEQVKGAKAVADLAHSGNLQAIKIFDDMGKNLAKIVKPIILELNIKTLYLGGQVSKSIDLFFDSLNEGLKDTCLEQIKVPENLDSVHLLGAIKFFLNN